MEVKIVTVTGAPAQEMLDQTAMSNVAAGQPLFLAPCQVARFLTALESDRHASIVQAPKVTCFNGQMSTVACNDQQFFVTRVDVTKVNGQMVYVPVNKPFPIGFELKMQPTVSADHKFVRCNLKLEHSEMGAANVPMFPVTTFITPIFEGGAQGQPIPFTQFIQQPDIVKRTIEKTVTIADGQTAVLYAGKRQKEEESQADGPCAPLFDWIYDLVDMFNPPADPPMIDEHMFVLVTPRVICTGEAEQKVAGCAAQPMPMGPCVPAPCCLPPAISQCAATATTPCCQPAAPCCSAAQPCAGAACPSCRLRPTRARRPISTFSWTCRSWRWTRPRGINR